MYATFDEESTKVAELRREAPRAAARAYAEALEAELARERQTLEGIMKEEEELIGEEKEKSGLQMGNGLERREEVEKTWGMGSDGWIGLGGVTGVLERLERAVKATGVVEGF